MARDYTRYLKASREIKMPHDIYLSQQVWPDTKKAAIALANNAPEGVMISTTVVDSRSVKEEGGE